MLRHLLSLAVALTITLADHGTEEGYVEINLADVDPGRCADLRIDLPFVCGVNFTGIENSSFFEYDRNDSVNSVSFDFNTTREDQPQLTVHLTFNDTERIACRQYIFNRSLTADPLVFQCEPVRRCGDPPLEGNVAMWKRFLNDTETRDFIDNPVDGTPSFQGDTLTPTRNVANTEDALGYYVPFLFVNSTIRPGQVFAIYLNPEFTNDDDRNYTVVEGKNTDAIVCSIRSFPPAIVTWEFSRNLTGLDESDSTIMERPGREFMNINRTNFRLAFDGQIVITNARTEDHGFYRCTAVNEASGNCTIRTRILRVRDKLRPLWPALGLILTLVSVAVIIIVNYLIEKYRGEKKLPLEEEDFDGEANDRLNSVSDADSPISSSSKEHAAIRRISSARQELIPSS